QSKTQDDGGCLRPDTLEACEPGARLVDRQIRQKGQVKTAALLRDRAQDLLDARSLLVGEPRRPDSIDDLRWIGIAHGLPAVEFRAQEREGAITVGIVGVLRKNSRNQLIDGWQRVTPDRLTVHFEQALMDLNGTFCK